jgi:hypothetical protein
LASILASGYWDTNFTLVEKNKNSLRWGNGTRHLEIAASIPIRTPAGKKRTNDYPENRDERDNIIIPPQGKCRGKNLRLIGAGGVLRGGTGYLPATRIYPQESMLYGI